VVEVLVVEEWGRLILSVVVVRKRVVVLVRKSTIQWMRTQ
jgi:hypothetical protein